jgi:hypothetical protein
MNRMSYGEKYCFLCHDIVFHMSYKRRAQRKNHKKSIVVYTFLIEVE